MDSYRAQQQQQPPMMMADLGARHYMVQLANRVSEAGAGSTLTKCDVNQWLRNDPRFRECMSPPLSGMEVRYRVAATLLSIYVGTIYARSLYAAAPAYTLRETLRFVIAVMALAGLWREVLRCRFWDGLLRAIVMLFVGGLILNILWPDPPMDLPDDDYDDGEEFGEVADHGEEGGAGKNGVSYFVQDNNRHGGTRSNADSVIVLNRQRVGPN